MEGVAIVALGIVAGILALALVVIVLAAIHNRQRSWGVQSYALAQGWAYAGADPDVAKTWSQIPVFSLKAHARDIVRGEHNDIPFVAFTLVPGREGHPEDAARHVSGVGLIALQTPGVIPTVMMTPEGFVERISTALGGEDIPTGHDDVDSAWRIRGDATTAHELLAAPVLDWLRDPDTNGSYGFENGYVLTWSIERFAPRDIEYYLEDLEALIARVPTGVWGLR